MSKKLIELKDVYKIYKKDEYEVKALDGVSLTINKGEFVSIIGASGSGKSTLMNMIGCLDTPTSGMFNLDEENVSDFSDRKLSYVRNQKIGFIFQGFNLIPSLNAFENIELPLMYRRIPKQERKKRSLDALSKVFLENRATHRPSQLSGGQQQRVAVARAIASEPEIILADEPTGNLDTKAGAQVMKILHELNEQGITIILITHDVEIAKQAMRNIKISDGKIVN